MRIWFILISLWASISNIAYAEQMQNWASWVAEVRKEALAQGISADVFDAAFADVHEPSRQVKGLARSQPEHRLTYTK